MFEAPVTELPRPAILPCETPAASNGPREAGSPIHPFPDFAELDESASSVGKPQHGVR
jgi:hypothetical protein